MTGNDCYYILLYSFRYQIPKKGPIFLTFDQIWPKDWQNMKKSRIFDTDQQILNTGDLTPQKGQKGPNNWQNM